jgi:hypothetical protein
MIIYPVIFHSRRNDATPISGSHADRLWQLTPEKKYRQGLRYSFVKVN